MITVERLERGWAGHYILADKCYFRRNTLLSASNGVKVIVSTVGNKYEESSNKIVKIGLYQYYETMVFMAADIDDYYIDADYAKEIRPNANSMICEITPDVDNVANQMHENIVNEMIVRLTSGEITDTESEE